MLKRKFESRLDMWLKSQYVLLVDGARQVGKTFLVKDFCQRHFENFIYINIVDSPYAKEAFSNARTVDEFYLVVSSFGNKAVIPHKTAVFIDEIQAAPGADFRTLSKALALDGRSRVVFSGSLLGVNENNVALDPAGYMYEERMFPLDFEEFLWALSVQQEVIEKARECFEKEEEVPLFIHDKLMVLFRLYLMVGGLPKCVQEYADRRDLKMVHMAHKSVEMYYRNDVTKYAAMDKRPYIAASYDAMPSELNSKCKRFVLSKLGKGYNLAKAENDFVWLTNAGIAIPVYNVDEPKIPLLSSKNSNLLKLFANDIGLLCYRLLDTDIQEKILARAKDINFGAIFENAVAQELYAHGYDGDRLFYFASKKQGEVDFLITHQGKVLPIEVKSGKDYKRHVALDNLLSNKEYDIAKAVVFGDCNVQKMGNRTYLPIYMADFFYSSAY